MKTLQEEQHDQSFDNGDATQTELDAAIAQAQAAQTAYETETGEDIPRPPI